MTYLIDAWLDRPHPYLRILHRETGEVCAVLEEEALAAFFRARSGAFIQDGWGFFVHSFNISTIIEI